MFEFRNLRRVVLGLLVAAIPSVPAAAARRGEPASPQEGPARVGVFGEGVVWEPLGDFDGATLVLSGPDGRTRLMAFEADVSPSFSLADLNQPEDGRYLWEIRFAPKLSDAQRQSLRMAAESDDAARTAELNRIYRIRHADLVQSGQFFVRGGRVEIDDDDSGSGDLSGQAMHATAEPGPRGPLATFDVSGDWTVTGDVGIGTDTPSQELDIVDASPAIQMEDSSSAFSWFVNGNDSGFDVRRSANGTSDRVFFLDPAAPKPSMWVDSAGRWGNGTSLPTAALHVKRADGTAKVLVDDDAAAVARRTLFELENNGGVDFRLRNSNTGVNWFFSQDSADNFVVSLSGTGGPEFLVRSNGRVQMGPGAATVFDLMPGGNLTIGGFLTELSDRDAKENFEPVDGAQILRKVVSLPLSTWNLKADPRALRHIGPTAQDFRAAFGLGGDPRHISAVDRSGVALAAIQGLNQGLVARDVELAELRARVQSQEEEIEELKTRLQALESLRDELAAWKSQAAKVSAGNSRR